MRLHVEIKEVETVDEIKVLNQKIRNVMEERERIQGFSAPQLGDYRKAFIIRRKGKMTFMANPVILWQWGSRKSNEGCETIKGRWIVRRPLLIKVEYLDEDGNKQIKTFTYKSARIICHEYDHLNNRTIADVGVRWRGEKFVRQ